MSKITTLRGLIQELRYAIPDSGLKDNLAFQYIVEQYRKYNTTDQQLCKAREEMDFIANSYLCYLRSSRLSRQIHDEFHGKGERSVQDTARMVGFKLPHDPK
ncbi:protein FMC1 homolog [Dendroctonus ponderosae]|uniref:Protein FMC1 homolog n=1 Tax=Dendroctonus ponderosae TaxID=77166 RepID=U4UGB9_DENPD|nr:protein FMC1 homolog [Dendroctonus ponderosae]ERL92077.1 hypothetical protein D910_09399 [Dendroctonus ponderosae]